MKHITVFFASPRKNGNSDKLGEAFSKGASLSGNVVNKVYIRDLEIHGCKGCEYCYEHNGICVQKDSMQDVYILLEKTDIIVFATPIYYQSFPSQLKAVIDRLYVTENRQFPISGAILLATYATEGAEMSEETIRYFKILINYHKWENCGILSVDGMDEIHDIDHHEALTSAFDLGYSLI